MRPIICDRCGDRIDDDWTGPLLEIEVSNGVDKDVGGDYCVDCARVVADAIREVLDDTDETGETIYVFEPEDRHAFGLAFVKGESESDALTRLKQNVEHRGTVFNFIGTHDEWSRDFRNANNHVYSTIYYR